MQGVSPATLWNVASATLKVDQKVGARHFTLREDLSVSHQSTDSSGGSWNVTGIVVLVAVVVVGVLFFPEVSVGGIIVRGVAAAAA